MKVAVVGATGQLGSALVTAAEARGHDVQPLARPDVDVTRPEALAAALDGADPDLVANAAAWTDVDACETDPRKAFDVNALGARHVAEATREADARLLHTSTDYVFPGDKPAKTGPTTPETAYVEADPPEPLNVYGASKLAGEHLAAQAHPDALVTRLSSLFGTRPEADAGPPNFVDAMIAMARAGETLTVVDDQHMTPTYAGHAAEALLDVVEDHPQASGVLHVTNPEACTWYDLAEAAVTEAGLDPPMERIPAAEFPREAHRPANSALATPRLQDLRGPLPGWRQGVRDHLEARPDPRS